MNRCCLIVLCLMISCISVLAQEPATESADTPPVADAKANQPKAIQILSPVLPLSIKFEEPDPKRLVVSGTFLDRDGLVLTVVPSTYNIKSILAHPDTLDYQVSGEATEVELLARDEQTGLALVKTPFRCERPFVLSDKSEPALNSRLDYVVQFSIPGNKFVRHFATVTAVNQDVTFGDGRHLSQLLEVQLGFRKPSGMSMALGPGLVQPAFKSAAYQLGRSSYSFQNLAEPGSMFIGDQRTIVAVALAVAGTEKTSSDTTARFVTCPALTGRVAREICNGLLAEAKLPPLPASQPAAALATAPPLAPHAVRLEVDYDNGDRSSVIGVFLDDQGVLVPSEAIQRNRLITVKQGELDAPVTVFRSLPEVGLTLLNRGNWTQERDSVWMTLKPTPLKVGDRLLTSLPQWASKTKAQEAMVEAVGITEQGWSYKRPETFERASGYKRPGSVELNQELELGMPLYNSQGQFVALVTSHPRPGASLAMAADDVWLAWARLGPSSLELLNQDEKRLRDAGRPVVRISYMKAEAAAVMVERLQPLYPELRISNAENGGAVVITLDPQQDEAVLGEMEMIRNQLEMAISVDPSIPGPTSSAAPPPQVQTAAVDRSLPVCDAPLIQLQLISDVEGVAKMKIHNAIFLNKAGDLVTWLPPDWLPGGKAGYQRLQVLPFNAPAPIPAEFVSRDEETGLTLLSAKLRCSLPYSWLVAPAVEGESEDRLIKLPPPLLSANPGASRHVALSNIEGMPLKDLEQLIHSQGQERPDPRARQEWFNSSLLTNELGGFNSAAGVVICDRKTHKLYVMPRIRVVEVCRKLLADNKRAPLFRLPSSDEVTALLSRPLLASCAWAVQRLQNGEPVISVATCFDEHGHYLHRIIPVNDHVRLFRNGKPLTIKWELGSDYSLTGLSVVTVHEGSAAEGHISMLPNESPIGVGNKLISQISFAGTRPTPEAVTVTAFDRRSSDLTWESQRVARIDQDLLPGEPLFRDHIMVALVFGPDDGPRGGSLIHSATTVAEAIERIRKQKFPSGTTDASIPATDAGSLSGSDSRLKHAEENKSVPQGTPSPAVSKKAVAGAGEERDIADLVRRYRTGANNEREAMRKQLLELTTRQFDQRHQQRLGELKTLESRLNSLRADLQKRQELRDEIIRKRVADLLSEENLLKWESDTLGETTPARSAAARQ